MFFLQSSFVYSPLYCFRRRSWFSSGFYKTLRNCVVFIFRYCRRFGRKAVVGKIMAKKLENITRFFFNFQKYSLFSFYFQEKIILLKNSLNFIGKQHGFPGVFSYSKIGCVFIVSIPCFRKYSYSYMVYFLCIYL